MSKVYNSFIETVNQNAFSVHAATVGVSLEEMLGLLARRCNRLEYKKIKHLDDLDPVRLNSAREIISMHVPEFQRGNDKWSDKMQTGFIFNLLKGLKAAPVSLYKIKGSPDEFILDGLQRITAVIRFFIEQDMEFLLPSGETISSSEIIDNGMGGIAANPFDLKIYEFDSELDAVNFYIEFNENVTHSPDDIVRAVTYRDKLIAHSH